MKIIIGIAIILLSTLLGFFAGGAYISNQFSDSYDAVIKELDRIDRGECEATKIKTPNKVFKIIIIPRKELTLNAPN